MRQTHPEHVFVKQGTHKGWESCQVHNGSLSLVVVPEVGGRIMGMYWRGHNVAFTQPEREGTVENTSAVSDVLAKKREMGFPLWGGEKTWLAPQSRWPDSLPLLDLDSGPYELTIAQSDPYGATVRMTSAICRETGIQISRTISMRGGSSEWRVSHEIVNASASVAEWGIWDVAMLLRPGCVYLPRYQDSQYPGGMKTFSQEGDSLRLRDSVVHTMENIAVVSCKHSRKYKYGVDPANRPHHQQEFSWILGIVEGTGVGLIGYRKHVQLFPDQHYAHGCFAEVYNSAIYPYFELETHGPLVKLSPGARFTLEERHALFDVTKWPENEREVIQLAVAPLSCTSIPL